MAQPPYVEDGAQADNDGEDERERERQRPVGWKFVTFGVAGVVCIIAGGIVVYLFYRRLRRLENALSRNILKTHDQGALLDYVHTNSENIAAKVTSVEAKLVKTQRFIVDMAQRQKWPWPFNNRIQGLEEEFGLPKH